MIHVKPSVPADGRSFHERDAKALPFSCAELARLLRRDARSGRSLNSLVHELDSRRTTRRTRTNLDPNSWPSTTINSPRNPPEFLAAARPIERGRLGYRVRGPPVGCPASLSSFGEHPTMIHVKPSPLRNRNFEADFVHL